MLTTAELYFEWFLGEGANVSTSEEQDRAARRFHERWSRCDQKALQISLEMLTAGLPRTTAAYGIATRVSNQLSVKQQRRRWWRLF